MGGCNYMKDRRRQRLMVTDPFCWYCGTELMWEPSNGPVPGNSAVVESFRSRAHTGGQPQGARNYLACYDCVKDKSRWRSMLTTSTSRAYWEQWRLERGYAPALTNAERRKAG